MPNNREGPLITLREIPETQEHNVENSIVAKGASKNKTPEKPSEDKEKEPQGQPVSVRTKETLPPQKEQTPQGVK
ncbi:hypothetical protein HYU72_01895 [Candidatus Berkelbacteria bacterium]|nr:hypothetical protein [Candidatus Berkelbacteria bacterium]